MRGLIYSSLAAAVVMAMSGTAFADYRGDRDETGATLTKKVKAEVDVEYEGRVNVGGFINVNKLGMAVVDNQQSSSMIGTANSRTENKSQIDGSFQDASGNVGANVAAGDSNVQGNSAALAAYDQVDADAEFVMGRGQQHGTPGGSSDAEIFSDQSASQNWTTNSGHQNEAGIGDGAFDGAAGNIGANVTSGSGNVQANNMAASVSTGNMAVATVANSQSVSKNLTENKSLSATKTVDYNPIYLKLKANGEYEGTSKQSNNVYPEIWKDGDHPGGGDMWGHIDYDNEGKNDGKFEFKEEGDIKLSGYATGYIPVVNTYTSRETFNHATIDGGSFNNAVGNIGVNVSSGTNNLQANNLSLAAGFAK
ncbi:MULTISPECIES: hypothetical protein [Aeromonas]|uniref:hypothetical protein n=1 Tax=Aeromonas TaxID=642 RepID=UPI001F4ABF70|nr:MULTISPECIES: hypothetical protein [Aeromonas]MCH7371578.1 hypothetical protein [Aeromonas sp. MR16]